MARHPPWALLLNTFGQNCLQFQSQKDINFKIYLSGSYIPDPLAKHDESALHTTQTNTTFCQPAYLNSAAKYGNAL